MHDPSRAPSLLAGHPPLTTESVHQHAPPDNRVSVILRMANGAMGKDEPGTPHVRLDPTHEARRGGCPPSEWKLMLWSLTLAVSLR